ncbi:hypothetical protein ASH00_15200 [Arthrobacter sp. Soil782]|uniref:YesL family protein n=1 Tax=Arthrobacter sp. Soil782 TaxID=1736410 RepID=UPI0006F35BD3|nr:DUF624 domain-containing protein [Arthrobacter sp. Soil782]KRF03998.1 hypothetical protein ASH00_15200 [Arthrobacter sp. Soil782]
MRNDNLHTDTPGWAGRLMDWLRFVLQLVLLNLLFLTGALAGLGILGIFPSAVATTALLARLRAGDPGDRLISDFVTAYRAQFLHANKVGSLFALAGLLAVLNAATLAQAEGGMQVVLSALAVVVSGALAVSAGAAVVMCSRYRDTVRRTWRSALVLPLASPVMTLSWLVTMAGVAVLFTGVSALLPLVGASLPLLVSGLLIGHRLDTLAGYKAENKTQNDDGAPARRLHPGRQHYLTA